MIGTIRTCRISFQASSLLILLLSLGGELSMCLDCAVDSIYTLPTHFAGSAWPSDGRQRRGAAGNRKQTVPFTFSNHAGCAWAYPAKGIA